MNAIFMIGGFCAKIQPLTRSITKPTLAILSLRLYMPFSSGVRFLSLFMVFILFGVSRLDANSISENIRNKEDANAEKKCKKIVTDRNRGLMWQDNEETKSVKTNFKQALGYCKRLRLGGYGDWKLPRIAELTTITDKSRKPKIKKEFHNAASNFYWSSSQSTLNKTYSWIVNFNTGCTNYSDSMNEGYVRCVRHLK